MIKPLGGGAQEGARLWWPPGRDRGTRKKACSPIKKYLSAQLLSQLPHPQPCQDASVLTPPPITALMHTKHLPCFLELSASPSAQHCLDTPLPPALSIRFVLHRPQCSIVYILFLVTNICGAVFPEVVSLDEPGVA